MFKVEHFYGAITPQLMYMLFEADPDYESINQYIDTSIKFVAIKDECCIGIAVLSVTQNVGQIKNISVQAEYRYQGVGMELINCLQTHAEKIGLNQLHVGTCNSSLGQLRFYQKLGFRIYDVIPNHFTKYPTPIFENGIRCQDLICLKIEW